MAKLPLSVIEKNKKNTTVPQNDDLLTKNIQKIPLSEIDYKTRDIDESRRSFQRLINSIKENDLIQPVVLKKKGERFDIIAGNRRVAASLKADKKDIAARIIKDDVSEVDICKIRLSENLAREDATPIELSRGVYSFLKALHPEYKLSDMITMFINSDTRPEKSLEHAGTVTAVKEITGQSASTIRNWLSIHKLPTELKRQIEKRNLGMTQAYILANHIDHPEFTSIADKVVTEKMKKLDLLDLLADSDSSVRFVKGTLKTLDNLEQRIRIKVGQISLEETNDLLKKLHDLCSLIEMHKEAKKPGLNI